MFSGHIVMGMISGNDHKRSQNYFFYRKIIEKSKEYLKKGGRLYFEIGHDQGDDVKKLMEDAGFAEVTVKKDLAGLDRVVFGV